MAEKKAEAKTKTVTKVTNNSTCDFTIDGVLIKSGESQNVPKFNPESKINAAFLACAMIVAK